MNVKKTLGALVVASLTSLGLGVPAHAQDGNNVAENGDHSTQCQINWTASAMMDQSVPGYEVSNFLEEPSPGQFGESTNGEKTVGAMQMQHYVEPDGLHWRLPLTASVDLENGKLDFTLPQIPDAPEPAYLRYGNTDIVLVYVEGYDKKKTDAMTATDNGWDAAPAVSGLGATASFAALSAKDYAFIEIIQPIPTGYSTAEHKPVATAHFTAKQTDCVVPPWPGSSDQCLAAGSTVGLGLAFLIPLGLASQIHVPGIDALAGQIQRQITAANNQIQQQTGLFNQEAANLAQQINARLAGPEGKALAGVALVAAGLLAGGYVVASCVPGSTTGSADGSVEGSSLSSDLSSGSSLDSSSES